jgi:hypothetical protein
MNDMGWAIKQLKDRGCVERAGWNGKGMCLFLVEFWWSNNISTKGDEPVAYGAPAEHHDALRGRMRSLARGTRHCIDEADQRAQAVARALGVTKENA